MLKLLQRMTQAVRSAPDMVSALTYVVEHVCTALEAESASVFICDDAEGEYLLMASTGVEAKIGDPIRLKYGEGLVGLVGEREEPMNIEDAHAHDSFSAHPLVDESAYHGFLGVPIIDKGQLLGVLVVQQRPVAFFTEEQEAFCITLVVQIAAEIAKAIARGQLSGLTGKRRRNRGERVFSGVTGAYGIAIGQAVVVYPPADLDAVPDKTVEDPEKEIHIFETALAAAREEMQAISMRATSALSVAEHAIFDAYMRILDSRTLINEVLSRIREGQWAQGALKHVIKQHVLQFESLEDPYLRERASDFRDLGRRILAQIQSKERAKLTFPKHTILVSDEVSATTLMEVPKECLKGVISGTGSCNSHVAILARALGLPSVMGVTGTPLDQFAEQECIVDGYNGQVYLAPSSGVKKEFRRLMQEEVALDEELGSQRDLPATTVDQHSIALYINTGLAVEGGLSLSVGAQGVGLYRTELPFMIKDRIPSEEEQRIMYRQLLTTFSPRPVVMRTLDIGGDKTLPYLTVTEENPFLGWRGIRVTLDHPEIFLQQTRAMLQASAGLSNLSIMLPMVTYVSEVEDSLRLINQAYSEVLEEGFEIEKPPIGLMIEVPAAAYQSYQFATRVDFLSVGSNDLIQYMLAVDRNNARVAGLYDGFHPAVLGMLQSVVHGAHRAGKKVSICGELAGDPVAVILLLAMGFDSLSMNARSLPRVKWVIRNLTRAYAEELLKDVMDMDDPKEVRMHLEVAMESMGLGGLIRAGR